MERPEVRIRSGTVRGVQRPTSAAFYGIPVARPPIGDLRFAAPVAAQPWEGVRDAAVPGPTPQRRPFGVATTIPEPSFPGDATLNVNVFTPAPGRTGAKLPVLVWIHGGGFFAGSPSSPWYDGASFNRDGVVTVSLSYRLGFDGFGWIADAPTNRGLRDLILGLEWVRDNVTAFGGDPNAVTIAGQSAGGTAVMALLASPLARGLFTRVIAHSAAGRICRSAAQAEAVGRGLAALAGVEPTRAGWSSLDEDAVLDLQTAYMTPSDAQPATAAEFVRGILAGEGIGLPFVPVWGDDVLPVDIADASGRDGAGGPDLLIGTVAHEFSSAADATREAWSSVDPVRALSDGGLSRPVAEAYVAANADLVWTADHCGQLVTDLSFRIPTIACADARQGRTWVYDFRWRSPVFGLAVHCLELPFAWDLLDADGVEAVTGPNPPQDLADEIHAAWVGFITIGEPGWPAWDGRNPRVFGGHQGDSYAPSRTLAAWWGLDHRRSATSGERR